jgi:type VI secretion system protein ImpL
MWVFLVVLIAAALLVAVLTAVVVWRARRQAVAESAAAPLAGPAVSDHHAILLPALIRELRPSFHASVERLRTVVRGVDFRYGVPWYVLMGPAESGKTTLVADSPESASLRPGPIDPDDANGISWHYFDGGVVIDVAASLAFRGSGEGASGWRALLELLKRYRPRRPIDGILLAVPAPLLLDDNWKTRTHDLGAAIRERLVLAQSALGFSLPVYLVVTQTDAVPGFSAFADALPDNLQQDMLGWSNPHDPETVFQGAWIDKAFEELHRSLVHTQLELFATERHLARASEIFLFPGELHRLAVPLRALLEETFRPSVYHAGFLFRGFYLTGRGPERIADAIGPAASPLHRRVVSFFSDLLEGKVFPERGLASPLPRAAIARNRVSQTAQIVAVALALVLAVGTTIAYGRLQRVRAVHESFFDQVEAEVDRHLRLNSAERNTTDRERILQSYELLQGIVAMSRDDFHSWFLPTSELAPIEPAAGQVLAETFAHLILPDFRLGLEERGRTLFSQTSDVSAAGEEEEVERVSPVLEGNTRYRALERFAQDYRHFVDNYFRYTALSQQHSGDLKDLAELANYVTGRSNVTAVAVPDEPYGRALRDAATNPMDCRPLDSLVEQKARRLLTDFSGSWFGDGNPVKASQARFIEQWHDLNANGTADFRDLDGELGTLAQSVKVWSSIGSRSSELRLPVLEQAPFKALNARNVCAELQPDLSDAIGRLASMRDRLTEELLTAAVEPLGPLVARGDKGLELGDTIGELKTALDDLRTRDFRTVLPVGSEEAALSPRAMWRPQVIDHAVTLLTSFDQYRSGAFPSFGNAVRRPLVAALTTDVAQSLATRMSFDAIEGESLPADSAALLAEVSRLGEELNKMTRLVTFFEEGGIAFADALVENLDRQAATALDRLEREAAASQPFIFARQSEPLFTAWSDIQSETSVPADRLKRWAVFADQQRESLRRYATLAEPLARFLVRTHASPEAAKRWTSIVDDVNGFDQKLAGNGLGVLDGFLRDSLPTIGPDNDCTVNLSSVRSTASYFVGVRNELADDARKRCRDLARAGVQARYGTIAGAFNRLLSARFPFNRGGPAAGEAALADVVEFLRIYERNEGRTLASQLQDRSCSEPATRFVRGIDALTPLLSPLRDLQSPALSLDVLPDFRINREREIGGNEIAQWQMDVGSQSFHDGEAAKPALWASGDPVRVLLRFAKDSPNRPLALAAGSRQIEERTVRFEYQGPWALIALLTTGRLSPSDTAGATDLTPTMLRFDVPVERDSAQPPLAAPAPPTEIFRVYMRVRLFQHGKPEAIAVEEFPILAPAAAVCPAR